MIPPPEQRAAVCWRQVLYQTSACVDHQTIADLDPKDGYPASLLDEGSPWSLAQAELG